MSRLDTAPTAAFAPVGAAGPRRAREGVIGQFAVPGVARLVRTVARVLEVTDLEHAHVGRDHALVRRESDQATDLHERFYARVDDTRAALEPIVRHALAVLFDEDVYVQDVPNLRIQFPDNLAVGEFHDDGMYHHQRAQLNLWLPLTRIEESSAVWIETAVGSGCYRPTVVPLGRILFFDGVRLRHGNVVNRTGRSRVSLDLRAIPVNAFESTHERSVNAGRRFVPGDYFAAESWRTR